MKTAALAVPTVDLNRMDPLPLRGFAVLIPTVAPARRPS
ncbi:hypothetical protein VT85_23735 [Planctomyces sp. SH-PL62]|nr:hypothetical protein VT85_23735 [Planctomyces sp. SH-PL62]